MCYGILGNVGPVDSHDVYPKAEAAALRALELDDGLADAHFARAWALAAYRYDWQTAEQEFQRGLNLNPNSAFGHSRFGWFLSWLGRFDEAIAEAERSLLLTPHDPNELQTLSVINLVARRYDDALRIALRATEIDPGRAFGFDRLGRAYIEKGMYPEAIAAMETAVKLSAGANHRGALGRAYAIGGRRQLAEQMVQEGINRYKASNARPVQIAMILAGLGKKEQALHWLEEGYRVRDGNMVLLKVFPDWDPLRAEPRFQDLLRRMRFP